MATPENLNSSQQDELARQEEARREAAELIAALREKEGKKAFMLVVDDEEKKRQWTARYVTREARHSGTGYVLSLKEDGGSAVRLYQAFREQDSAENPTTVVAVLDGNLGPRGATYETGLQVANKLVDLSTANGWEVPFLLGASGTSDLNSKLQKAYPEQYITNFPTPNALDQIDSKL